MPAGCHASWSIGIRARELEPTWRPDLGKVATVVPLPCDPQLLQRQVVLHLPVPQRRLLGFRLPGTAVLAFLFNITTQCEN